MENHIEGWWDWLAKLLYYIHVMKAILEFDLNDPDDTVPWGKGEKHPDEGSETVSETGRLQAVGASLRGDGVPFV